MGRGLQESTWTTNVLLRPTKPKVGIRRQITIAIFACMSRVSRHHGAYAYMLLFAGG